MAVKSILQQIPRFLSFMREGIMNTSTTCPNKLASDLFKHYDFVKDKFIISAIINIVSSIISTLGNGLVFVVILKTNRLRSPSYLLIASLALTDLLSGLIANTYHAVTYILMLHKNTDLLCSNAFLLGVIADFPVYLFMVSIFMNALISVDRYLALRLKHRYRTVVTRRRVKTAIVASWLSVLVIFLTMKTSLVFMPQLYFPFILFTIVLLAILSCIILSCYILSFIKLHLYTTQVRVEQPNTLQNNFDVLGYKKTLKTMSIIFVYFLITFIAVMVLGVYLYLHALKDQAAVTVYFVFILAFGVNWCVYPVIYLTRFRDIKLECWNVFPSITNNEVNNE